MSKKNKKKISEEIVKSDNFDEPTIDGKKLSEVFSSEENQAGFEEYKIEKKGKLKDDFEINFDPNADVKLKKKKTLKRVISWAVICVLVVVGGYAGSIVGNILIGMFFTEKYDPNAVTVSELVEDEATIKSWTNLPISAMSATQVFVVAEYNLKNCTYYSVTTQGYNGEESGSVIANVPLLGLVNQSLKGYRYRNGDVGYFDYYTSGYMPVVKKTDFTFGGDQCFTYNLKGEEWVIEKSPVTGNDFRTAEEFKNDIGCDVENPIDYIVSTKTVLTEVSNGMVGEYYSFTITLNPATAVANYAKKMNYMAGLGFPTFSDVELRFEVDANMNFRNIYIKEHYDVPGLASTEAMFSNEFNYENIEIK